MNEIDLREYAEVLIKPLFDYGLIKGTAKGINEVLMRQFQPDIYGELGGSVFFNRKGLEFRLVYPKRTKDLEDTIDKFEAGEIVDLGEVVKEAKARYELQKDENENSIYTMVFKKVYEMFDGLNKNKETIPSIDKNIRKKRAELFREDILNGVFLATLEELRVNDVGFLATFHVHQDGEAPSKTDLEYTIDYQIPVLVISATKDYIDEGIKLYVVHNGKFDLLYEGTIYGKPKNVS